MMRQKRRYILVESSKEILEESRKEFEIGLYTALMLQLGEAEYFTANPKVMKFIGKNQLILRVTIEKYGAAIVALTLIKSIGAKHQGLYTIFASGTIKALEKSLKE